MSSVRSTGLVLNAALVTGGRAIVEIVSDGTIRYLVGGAPAPVDITAPVTTRARAVAYSGRSGNVTFALTPRVLRETAAKRSPLGKYASVADAIQRDPRMDRFSKHEKALLIKRMNAVFAE